MAKRLTTEQFIEKATKVHNNKFDYSKVDYVDSKTKVIIVCPIHGEFTQISGGHLFGRGCSKCSSIRMTTESFIEKATKGYGNIYGYSKVDYVDTYTEVIINCPIHGEFTQKPCYHLSCLGCPKCAREARKLNLKVWQERLPADTLQLIDGNITTNCKTCGKTRPVNRKQLSNRWRGFTGKISGEHSFYCSDSCKNACPVFNFKATSIDPRSIVAQSKEDKDLARQCQTDHLKQIQCDTHGYNYCEKCGDIIDVELHHTHEVAKHGKDAITSAGHILLCAGCHVETHNECLVN